MQYQQEPFGPFIDECQDLIVDHWNAVALDQDSIPLDPDWKLYRAMDAKGVIHLTTARHHGKLVGYVVYLLTTALHYRNLQVAEADMFWLDKAHRKGMAGIHMLRNAEGALTDLGVEKMFTKVKLHYDVGKVFEYMGHAPIERVYAKGLN